MEIKTFKTNKILSIIAYALACVVALYLFLDVLTTGGDWAPLGYAIALIITGYALAIALIPTLVGLIRSIIGVKKGYCEKSTLKFFIIFTALPFATFLVGYLSLVIFVN